MLLVGLLPAGLTDAYSDVGLIGYYDESQNAAWRAPR